MNRLLRGAVVGVVLTAGAVTAALAQDSSSIKRVALGITYGGGARPGMIVIGAPGLDSVRKIVERDLLANSDHYEAAFVPDSTNGALLTIDALKGIGIRWGVVLTPAPGGVQSRLYNLVTGVLVQDATRALDIRGEGDSRLAIHQLSDEIQSWTGEGKGIAATRVMMKIKRGDDDRIWRIDSDGQNLVPVTRAGPYFYITPAWGPDGERIAYSEYSDGVWTLWLQTLKTGTRNRVQSKSNNSSPAFAPDGQTLAFQRDAEKGANIWTVEISGTICCEEQKNPTRFADNIHPTYSPNGARIAFVTNRAGSRQIWVMDRDGSLPSVLVIPETGLGSAGAPAWSPDGSTIAYSQDVQGGGRQVRLYNIASGRTTVLAASGLNDTPSWAPDSRHLVVKTNRSGREQLMIFDILTQASRPLITPGSTTYPAWSPALGATNPRNGGPQ